MCGTVEAVSIYREYFEPSVILDRPYTIVTASAIAAETGDRARWLAAPGRLRRFGMRTGRLIPLLSPDEAIAHEDFVHAERMPSSSILGTAAEVVAGLAELAERTEASELMLYTATHGLDDRLESLAIVAEAWAQVDDVEPASSSPTD
ncbi:MAG: hypothetical protein ACR2QK_14445, partial [Acidimicrobiales bacterium]